MKKVIFLLSIFLTGVAPLRAAGDFFDYQNYNHGYCPRCGSYPCRCNADPRNYPQPPAVVIPDSNPPPASDCPNCQPRPAPNPIPYSNPPPSTCPNCPRNPPSPIPPPPDSLPPSPASCEPCSGANPCPSCSGNASCAIPRAPVSGTECGVSICAIGIGLVAVAAAAAIIVASGNGTVAHSAHN